MNRRTLRGLLFVTLLIAASFAAWGWFRPYAWNVDPAARCKVVGCQVKQDLAYYWVDVHLKMQPGEAHDLLKPVRLRTGAGHELEPADVTLSGDEGRGNTDLWFKFWIEAHDTEGPLTLHINDGSLVIKSTSGRPDLGPSQLEFFTTHRW